MDYYNNLYETVQPVKTKKVKAGFAVAVSLSVLLVCGGIGFGASQLYIRLGGLFGEGVFDTSPNQANLPFIPENAVTEQVSLPGNTLTTPNDGEELTASQLFEKVNDTVVGIKAVYGSGSGSKSTGIIGSGVMFTTDGYILTCEHVVADAKKIIVVVDDYDDPTVQHEYDAVITGTDQPTDIAVVKITRPEPFKAAAIGNSGELKVGQDVCAIGNPVELEKTMTKGIVSGLKRDLDGDTYALPSIQTDASVNPGNSGCPLFDMHGNIVGIVNIKIVYGAEIDNLGFAISIDEAKPVINELLESGTISRAMLGITAREITNAGMMGVDVESGLLVDSVRPGTPAASSGLARGDIITKIDGIEIVSITDVHAALKDKKAGDSVKVTVVRYNNYGEKDTFTLEFALASSGDMN